MNPRKPTKLKLVTGTMKPSRMNHAEPAPQAGRIPMPRGLTPLHQTAWKRLAGAIQRMGATSLPDAVALERLVACYVEILEAEESIKRPIVAERTMKDGEIREMVICEAGERYYTAYGQSGFMVRERPEFGVIRSADQRLKGYLNEFGLTPASRSKVSVLPTKKAEPASRYFDVF
jgi:P27 family predicted phage terminase small subunit